MNNTGINILFKQNFKKGLDSVAKNLKSLEKQYVTVNMKCHYKPAQRKAHNDIGQIADFTHVNGS